MEIDKEVLKGYIDTIILCMLSHESLYGYELGKRVKLETGGRFELKEGTLYLAFKRLETNGYVESYWGEEGGGGRRKYYRLLPEGRRYLRHKGQEWEALKEIVNHFLKGADFDEPKPS